MKTKIPLLVAGGCFLLAACDLELDPPYRQVPLERLNSEPDAFTQYSGLREPKELVVDDEEAWADVWARIHEDVSPKPELPEVDFDEKVVLVTALGEQPTGGYSIFFAGAVRRENEIVVDVSTMSPGAGCGVTDALTQPIDIALLARTNARIEFRRHAEVRVCE